jgi:hypothetical protein
VHALLGLGPAGCLQDSDRNVEIALLEYFQRGGPWRGQSIYTPAGSGLEVRTSTHPGEIQRHPDQFLAYFAQAGVPVDMPLIIEGRARAVRDLLSRSKEKFNPSQEASFSLIAMSAYAGIDENWQNEFGESFSHEKLVRLELSAPIERLSCGGTHHLFALGFALEFARRRGSGSNSLWKDVESTLSEAKQRVQGTQLSDGSFGPELMASLNGPDIDTKSDVAKLNSTGHHLEWIVTTTTRE